jgi:hypothetical protein
MPRFTVRRMMVALLVVAVGLGAYETWCRWSSHRRLCLEKVAMHEWAGVSLWRRSPRRWAAAGGRPSDTWPRHPRGDIGASRPAKPSVGP